MEHRLSDGDPGFPIESRAALADFVSHGGLIGNAGSVTSAISKGNQRADA
jgi:hypothetical protein